MIVDTIPQTEQEKLTGALCTLEDSVSMLEEISSIDVMDTSPSEVEYQLQDMDDELSNIRAVIDTLEDIQFNLGKNLLKLTINGEQK